MLFLYTINCIFGKKEKYMSVYLTESRFYGWATWVNLAGESKVEEYCSNRSICGSEATPRYEKQLCVSEKRLCGLWVYFPQSWKPVSSHTASLICISGGFRRHIIITAVTCSSEWNQEVFLSGEESTMSPFTLHSQTLDTARCNCTLSQQKPQTASIFSSNIHHTTLIRSFTDAD